MGKNVNQLYLIDALRNNKNNRTGRASFVPKVWYMVNKTEHHVLLWLRFRLLIGLFIFPIYSSAYMRINFRCFGTGMTEKFLDVLLKNRSASAASHLRSGAVFKRNVLMAEPGMADGGP